MFRCAGHRHDRSQSVIPSRGFPSAGRWPTALARARSSVSLLRLHSWTFEHDDGADNHLGNLHPPAMTERAQWHVRAVRRAIGPADLAVEREVDPHLAQRDGVLMVLHVR